MVVVPEGVDEAGVRGRLLAEFDLEVGAGLGALAGKAWRVGLMGYASRPENVLRCLRAFATVLDGTGDKQVADAAATAEAAETAALAVLQSS